MSTATVYGVFERDLQRSAARYAGRPGQEMISLLLLGLEREEMVSVNYREAAVVQRLAQMSLDGEVHEIIRQALLWIWKDEEMHATYVRGALVGLRSPWLRVRSVLQQAMGAVAGWAASVRQHVRWRQAPLSRLLATAVSCAGLVLGKVPGAVWRELRYRSFRGFCLFNVEAEETAALCWRRLHQLASACADVSASTVADIRRMWTDEERHRQVFSILAAALDDDDRLVPGETAQTLERKLRAVGDFFVRRERRAGATAWNPIGSGGTVRVVEGRAAGDKLALFRRVLDDSGLPELLRARAAALGKPVSALSVAVKPTFMLGYHTKDLSTLTDPELLRELGRYLRRHGCGDVAVVEARNLYDCFYANRSVKAVADYFGISSPELRLVDLSAEQVPHVYPRGMGQSTIGATWMAADFRVSFGKLRSHPIDHVSLGIGNLENLGARCDVFLFGERYARRETGLMTLVSDFPPHFCLLDGYERAPDGVAGVMACPRPRAPGRLYAGVDALAVDMVAARHMGLDDPRQSPTLRAACHWFGDPSSRIRVVGVDAPIAGWRGPHHSPFATLLSALASPAYVMASARGALFVPEMDEATFPPLRPPGVWLRVGRRMVRRLLGVRHG